MAQMYRNASLTIAAVAANDSSHGFLGPRNNFNSQNSCKLRYWDATNCPNDSLTITYEGNDERLMPGFHHIHDQRAWTLQERILSTRVLSFANDKMFWECDERRRLESLHFEIADNRRDYRIVRLSTNVIDSSTIYRWWYEVLDDYCQRKLTFQMDKLPAISGLAALVQDKTSDSYLAGIWQGDIASGLAWKNHLNSGWADPSLEGRKLPYRVPSWSWARSDCGAAVPTFPVADEFNGTIHGYVDFVSAYIGLSGSDPYGRIKQGASLRIRGRTKTAFMVKGLEISPGHFAHSASVVVRLPYLTTALTTLRVSIDDPKFHIELLDQEHSIGEIWPDEHEGVEITTMKLCNCEVRSGYSKALLSYGLVLMRNANDDTFRRVGLLDSAYQATGEEPTAIDDWFADSEMQEVTLI